MPTSGAVTLAHIVGTTPEAPTLEAAMGNNRPEQVIRVGKREMKETWERLNVWEDDTVEHVAFGCPHTTVPIPQLMRSGELPPFWKGKPSRPLF